MYDEHDIPTALLDFCGYTRLFPLPNLVFFPHVMEPLHIFEPRYREMLEEAMDGDRLITIANFEPGWERQYERRPRLKTIGCIGRIVSHQLLDDGTANILLLGLSRVRIRRELPPDKMFREAKVELLHDHYPPATESKRAAMRDRLMGVFRGSLNHCPEAAQQLDVLLGPDIPLGMLTDVVASSLRLSQQAKMKLLAETNVDRRLAMILRLVEGESHELRPVSCSGKYPPEFSLN